VAALFTREFFLAARERLNTGGIICQWAHTYDISEADLRSVVATFVSVFPGGTAWLIGSGDLLLVASADAQGLELENLARGWHEPAIAADLRSVSAVEPFQYLAMYAAGPAELTQYGAGAAIQTDDRMALEFSGPRSINDPGAGAHNAGELRALLLTPPNVVRRAFDGATAAQWRDRGSMMRRIGDQPAAYDDYARAVAADPADSASLRGLVESALAAGRDGAAQDLLEAAGVKHPTTSAIWIAISRLLAARGSVDGAVEAATRAVTLQPADGGGLEQLASIFADAGAADRLAPVVDQLRAQQPHSAGTLYYAAAYHFLRQEMPAARDSAEQALAADPGYVAAHNLLGAVYGTLGRPDDARKSFEAALKLNPSDASIYGNLGLLELTLGNPQSAFDYFAEGLSLDPASTTARNGLAQARNALQD
jgi:tetratricopeptide (TPR) repeat protein